MPVIVFASNKGGVGKTTSSILLGTTLAHQQIPVVMLDADQSSNSLTKWARLECVPDNITVVSDIGESNIGTAIKQYDVDGTIVIVDLEGLASRLTSRAIARADLVIVPVGASTIEANVAQETLKMIKDEEEDRERRIGHVVLFNAIPTQWKTVEEKRARSLMEAAGVEVLEACLPFSMTFRDPFYNGTGLYHITDKGKRELSKAIGHCEVYTEAVKARLLKELPA